jgi:hypothetical protein
MPDSFFFRCHRGVIEAIEHQGPHPFPDHDRTIEARSWLYKERASPVLEQ